MHRRSRRPNPNPSRAAALPRPPLYSQRQAKYKDISLLQQNSWAPIGNRRPLKARSPSKYRCVDCRCSTTTATSCDTDGDCPSSEICKQKCAGGTSAEAACVDHGECPGGGYCRAHCYGGSKDGELCGENSECPGGTCKGRLDYEGTDWPVTITTDSVTWATTPYAQNKNANALRWGTLYNFRFRANRAPLTGNVTIGLFKSGGSQTVSTLVPAGQLAEIGCDP